MAVTKNQEYTVTVEGYSGEGAGVARIDGFVVFVSGALRGEVCRVLILKVLKSAAFAKVLEVLVPSPHRIAPDCPYFPRCGGCTYRHMDYAEELALKRRRVQDNLARIGGSEVEVEEILGAAETRRYRNKAQYPVSPDGRIGFYRARTHEVIDTRECLLVKPEADAAAEAVRQYMRDFRAAGYDERTGRGLLRHVYVRSNTKSESLICLLVNGKRLPHEAELVERLRRACPKAVGIVLGALTLFLLDELVRRRGGGEVHSDFLLLSAITLHNIPEGMAVGVVYAGYLSGSAQITAAGALALSLGIAIQNFPEGAIISLPLRAEGMGKARAFWGGVLSGIVEPIGAVLTILAASLIVPALPYLLSFAAGAMLYVVVEELIPEMSQGAHSNIGTVFFAVGFSLMMVLDVALG